MFGMVFASSATGHSSRGLLVENFDRTDAINFKLTSRKSRQPVLGRCAGSADWPACVDLRFPRSPGLRVRQRLRSAPDARARPPPRAPGAVGTGFAVHETPKKPSIEKPDALHVPPRRSNHRCVKGALLQQTS